MTSRQEQAFDNALKAVDSNLTFPQYVFTQKLWTTYFFFEDMLLFQAVFIEAIRSLLEIERSNAACIVNLNRLDWPMPRGLAAIYFDGRSNGDEYEREMRGDLTANSWLRNIECYVCTSDKGGWCIYCASSF